MSKNILSNLEELQQEILATDISPKAINTKEWSGADVIIKDHVNTGIQKWLDAQPTVISFQNTTPRRRAVITNYSKELSWLFNKLKVIFSDKIDYVSKYDFYGMLAQSAIDYVIDNKDSKSVNDLLIAVLNKAKGFC